MHSGFEIPGGGILQQDNPTHFVETQQLFLDHYMTAAASSPSPASYFKLHRNEAPQSPNWPNKQTLFWGRAEEVSNENRVGGGVQHFGELEAAIYINNNNNNNNNRPTEQSTTTTTQTTCPPNDEMHLPLVHGSDQASASARKNNKKKKKAASRDELYLGKLVQRVMDHQENLHNKFMEVVERLDGERREREKAWRNEELAHFERQAEARLQDKALAMAREAIILSYLEKFTECVKSFEILKEALIKLKLPCW